MKYRIAVPFPFKGRMALRKYIADNDLKIINEGFTRPARWVCELDIDPEDATQLVLTLGVKVEECDDEADNLLLHEQLSPLLDTFAFSRKLSYSPDNLTIKILKPRVSNENTFYWDPNFKIVDFKD